MLLGLKPVDAVVIFDEDTPINIISIIKPAIHVKGGDYSVKLLPEYNAVVSNGGGWNAYLSLKDIQHRQSSIKL